MQACSSMNLEQQSRLHLIKFCSKQGVTVIKSIMDVDRLKSWWVGATFHLSSYSISSICFMVLCCLLSLIVIRLVHAHFFENLTQKLPPGPSPLPFLGNLHQLLKPRPHQALAKLAKKHGPLMCLKMGSKLALFISNGTMAKTFIQANDRYFASRPCFTFCNRLLYGQHNGVAFSIYGPRWRTMRRICTLELFTTKRIQSFQKVLEAELKLVVNDLNLLCQQNKGAVELNVAHLAHLVVSNMMGHLVLSKRMCDTIVNGESLLEMFKKTNDAIVPAVGDFIPFMGHLLDLKSTRRMDRVHKHIDEFWKAILEERRKDRETRPHSAPMDFLDVLLSNKEVAELGDDNIKATLMDILGAGSETSAITIEWAIAELLRSPQCFAKLQTELDKASPIVASSLLPPSLLSSSASSTPLSLLPWQSVLSSSSPSLLSTTPPLSLSLLASLPSPPLPYSHIAQAHYLKAVVKETLRLHPPVPLLIPRASTGASCEVGGYTFAANTMLFVNAWAIGQDGEVWEKPEVFQPERFMGCSKDGIMDLHNNFQLLPFGAGRRRCPGMGLALCIMELTVATLVRAFHWELPGGQLLDMSEKSGSAGTHKAQPLLAVVRPR